jgi:glycosyltransferase involved in cell wall biosynthesis
MPVPSERLKVVRIVARLNVGGPAREVAILSTHLVAAGFDTLLVHGSLAKGEASLECPVGPHVRIEQLAELGREVRPFHDLAALIRLTRLMHREQPDIVDTHASKAGTLGRLAAFAYNVARPRQRRCLVVHTFHGHVFRSYFGRLGSWAVRVAERGLAALTDIVVTISPRQRDDIVSEYRIAPADRVAVMRLGLDLGPLLAVDRRTPNLRAELGYGENDFVLGFVGRLVPIKDPAMLIRAFALVARDVPNARLMIVGDGELRSDLEALVASLGLGGVVSLLGWRRDLSHIYSTLDVLVLTSLSEGTPLALIEAMTAGKAVVATAVGGVPDVVADGVTGLLVPPGQPAELARAVIALTEPEVRTRMGQAGRVRSSDYAADRLVADAAQLYRTGLNRKRGHRGGQG